MSSQLLKRVKVGLMVVAIATAWTGLWYLTMPIYSRLWEFKTLSVYGFIIFLAFGFLSLPLYGLGSKSTAGPYHALYWLPIGLGILMAITWGLSSVP